MESKFKYTQIKQTGTEKVNYPETRLDSLLKQSGKLIEEITELGLCLRNKRQEVFIINYNLRQIK